MARHEEMDYDDYEERDREARPRGHGRQPQGEEGGGRQGQQGGQTPLTSDAGKLALALAGGYLLGRTKKLKLVLSLGMWYVMQRAGERPMQMLEQGLSGDRMQKAVGERGSKLLESGKQLAVNAMTSRLDRWTETLQQRTEALNEEGGEEEDQREQRGRSQQPSREQRSQEPRREQRSQEPREQGGQEDEEEAYSQPRGRRSEGAGRGAEEQEDEQPQPTARSRRPDEGRGRGQEEQDDEGRRPQRQAARGEEEEGGDWQEDDRPRAGRSGGSREYAQGRRRGEGE